MATNGDPAAVAGEALTPAQRLMQKHSADEAHRTTVEEVEDEEDIKHPPPSAHLHDSVPAPAPVERDASAGAQEESAPLSEKAAGKQPMKEDQEPAASAAAKAKRKEDAVPFNPQSEEAFPTLGAPKPRAPVVPPAWGAKKPASGSTTPAAAAAATATAFPAATPPNGINGAANGLATTPSGASSRASTPASAVPAPVGAGMQRPPVTLPGRYRETLVIHPSMMIPRAQMKRPVTEVIRDINRRSKANLEMKQGVAGRLVIEGLGPEQAVRDALKEAARELYQKKTIKFPVPAAVRGHIIGQGGATINNIIKKSGAKIQVPRQEETNIVADEDDDSATIDVQIEGDPLAIQIAQNAINEVVNARTSTVNLRLRDIPAEYYPFLAGPHNSRIRDLEEGRDVRVQIPQYHMHGGRAPPMPESRERAAAFVPQANLPIHISGDRRAAQEVREAIEREAEALKRQLTAEEMPVERGRHQFVVGERGSSLHDFLEETGCSIIMPPMSDDSESIYIVGPADCIDEGVSKIVDLATKMSMTSVDVAKQHASAPEGGAGHARNLGRYLRQRQFIQELERQHNASIVLPPPSVELPTAWQVYSNDGKAMMRARQDIMNLVSGHPPTRLTNMDVDPFFHERLRQQHAQQIRENLGVHIVFPEEQLDPASTPLLLVYEGLPSPAEYEMPRRQPSARDVQLFRQALQDARNAIDRLVGSLDAIVSRDIETPQRFQDKLRRYVDRQQQALPQAQIPVQYRFNPQLQPQAAAAPASAANAAAGVRQPGQINNAIFSMRGPGPAVDDLAEKIAAFLEQEHKDELERGYTTTCDFPQKFANVLIGRNGATISKLREEFDVDIQVNAGKVEIKGPKAKADACRQHIINMGKRLEDEATHTLKIKPQYHRDLIGAKGAQVNRLQDRYKVRIQFPRNSPAANGHDDGDAATDAGASARNFRNQASDEVVVRGPSRGADQARDELLSLLQWTVDNSHTSTVSVAQSQIPQLIGQGGREMEQMRLATGAQIDVPGLREGAGAAGSQDPSSRVEIRLKGTKKKVEEAKKLLEERAKAFDDTVVRTVEVDKRHHKALIGSGGANIRDIVIAAGGPDDRRSLARMVRFPQQDSSDNTIRVEGPTAVADKIVSAIKSLVQQREAQVTDTVEVAPDRHRLLIGRGGETRRGLEAEFNVTVDVPKQSAMGAARNQVKVVGLPADVERCKERILQMVKEQEGETVAVPRALHHRVADNGQLFRRLRNELRVTVDHDRQTPPPKPAGANGRAGSAGAAAAGRTRTAANGAQLPLITDEQQVGEGTSESTAANETYSWEIVDEEPPLPSTADETDSGDQAGGSTIPWILRGPTAAAVSSARAIVEDALASATKPSATGYLILPDPRAYRLVVGPGGSQINSIRRRTGTRVQVPRDQARGEAIEIVGERKGVEQAKDIILGLVKGGAGGAGGKGGNGGRRRGGSGE
ncbi:hypothetical protein BDY21DRAFT_374569 [Lineolata rhizophorae]|uniref:K Homology domain-containing protein n=1 Tax=Lineolata rhizophorae TaxID=578093 RepID=A0A6A6NQH5_9PEZI|nr:hypothetical protein BDY21DRAFT_374569 [Lineolata rhizophorae]